MLISPTPRVNKCKICNRSSYHHWTKRVPLKQSSLSKQHNWLYYIDLHPDPVVTELRVLCLWRFWTSCEGNGFVPSALPRTPLQHRVTWHLCVHFWTPNERNLLDRQLPFLTRLNCFSSNITHFTITTALWVSHHQQELWEMASFQKAEENWMTPVLCCRFWLILSPHPKHFGFLVFQSPSVDFTASSLFPFLCYSVARPQDFPTANIISQVNKKLQNWPLNWWLRFIS